MIDFGSIHLYPEYWGLSAAGGSTWISDHTQIARSRQLGKPLLLGEFGYSGSPWSVIGLWMQTFETQKAGGALIWEMNAQSFAAGATRSYGWSWPGTSVPGFYTVRVGVYSGDWGTLYASTNPAATFSVQAAPTASFTVTSTTVSPLPVRRGHTMKVNTSVMATAAASGIRLNLEIYDVTGAKVSQYVCTKSFSAGQTQSCSWSYKVPRSLAPGTYTVKVGVLSGDGSTLYTSVNPAATFVVQ